VEIKHTEEIDGLFEAILSLETVDECYAFFEDALTVKEIAEISQRIKAAKMLSAGKSYIEVCSATGMSTATISRVSKALERGAGGYRLVIERIKENSGEK
jgi:TrpR-related protein YerC/YecD